MKANAGARSIIAEAKVGELYPIPKYMNICTQELQEPPEIQVNTHTGTKHTYIIDSYKQVPEQTKEEDST